MRPIRSLQGILKPALIKMFIFITFSIIFVAGYISTIYQQHLDTWQTTQGREIEAINQKVKSAFRDLGMLLDLASSQICAADQENLQAYSRRVQKTLDSLPHLQSPPAHPPLQQVTFYKLSLPQMIVTRLGALPFVSPKVPLAKTTPQNRNPIFFLKDKTIVGKMNVINPRGALEGILEVQISLPEFKRFLGTYETVGFNQNPSSPASKLVPPISLSIYPKTPDSFLAYVLVGEFHHKVFAFYALLFSILIGLGIRDTEKTLKANLRKHQKELELHQISCQSQKAFYNNLRNTQKTQAQSIVEFLEAVQSFQPELEFLMDEEKIRNMDICLKRSKALSKGLWSPESQEDIDLQEVLKAASLYFTEKISQSNITLEMPLSPEPYLLKGDLLLIKLLLVNIIGKSIYRVPDKGTVSVCLKKMEGVFFTWKFKTMVMGEYR